MLSLTHPRAIGSVQDPRDAEPTSRQPMITTVAVLLAVVVSVAVLVVAVAAAAAAVLATALVVMDTGIVDIASAARDRATTTRIAEGIDHLPDVDLLMTTHHPEEVAMMILTAVTIPLTPMLTDGRTTARLLQEISHRATVAILGMVDIHAMLIIVAIDLGNWHDPNQLLSPRADTF